MDGFDLPPSTVVFTFDDGPNGHNDTTARLLDVLKKYEVRAMFSLLGENVEAFPDLTRRIYNEGHIIINHGYYDKLVSVMGYDQFKDNLLLCEIAISSAIGKELYPKLYRPHGGFFNSRQDEICIEEGYVIIPGNIRVYDAVISEKGKDRVIKRVIDKVLKNNGGIILLHDARDSHFKKAENLERNPHGVYNRSWIPEATEEIILALLARGFNLNGSLHILDY
jgi:peptidoglycan/xylan/chitin deacetylase (PgdA/CDA1 family)